MKHILIGTAGHVDHGKTQLIKALTGIDTDRLQEEKARGITIDIGFAYMKLSTDEVVGIVDVPGHEKFIRNMLAGAGGIDLVLMIIAADDSVMPQTREHMDILGLLRAKSGIIVITKCDLVDEEWLDMVEIDINDLVKDSFLEYAPIIRVSSLTGAGINELKTLIESHIKKTQDNFYKEGLFRLPVDRVFTQDGFGTVVTGTLIDGSLKLNEQIMIYPFIRESKIRSIQVHGKETSIAYPGQRVAVNLSGITKNDIARGDIVARPGTINLSRIIDVKINTLKNSRPIKTGSRLHFFYGTKSVLCKIVLFEKDILEPLDTSYAQLRFSEDVAVKYGDPFVLRFYSPMETIGGGVVLNETAKITRKNKFEQKIKALKTLESGDDKARIWQMINDTGFAKKGIFPEDILNKMAEEKSIYFINESHIITDEYMQNLNKKIGSVLAAFHKKNPLLTGMLKEELRSRVLPDIKPALFYSLLENSKIVSISSSFVSLSDFRVSFTKEQLLIKENIEKLFNNFTPPAISSIKLNKQVFDAMINSGEIIVTEPDIAFSIQAINRAKQIALELENFAIAAFRDKLGTSRKFALSILDYFDRIGFTRKTGDIRKVI